MGAHKNDDSGDMAGFLVRWTNDDLEANVPARLKEALRVTGAERAKLSRSLLINWIEEIEDNGPAQIKYASARVNERPPTYGRKKAERKK